MCRASLFCICSGNIILTGYTRRIKFGELVTYGDQPERI